MSIDKTLQLIQTGRMSQILLSQFKEKLDERKGIALAKLTQLYRNGETNPVLLASRLAAYCELEDFETQLTKEVTRGERVAEEKHATGNPTTSP